jgi:septal ring factor EnvC (AmiA/AmiB activator)
MQRFLSLGAECVKIQETANASQGISSVLLTPAFYFYVLVSISLMAADVSFFFSFFCATVALTMARARISALEAELKASVEAWESANAAKVSIEKAAKLVETRAKKAEKALVDANQRQAKREQSVAERLDKISVSVGSKCCITPFWILTQAFIC